MAKNKHQKLADFMQQILNGIETLTSQVYQCCDLIQFYFYERYYIIGRPLIPIRVLQQMMHTHKIGMQHLTTNHDLREAARIKPLYGIVMAPDVIPTNQFLHRQTEGWFIPWGVQTILPKDIDPTIIWQDELLYCSHASEHNKCLQWTEDEDATSSFTYLVLSLEAGLQEEQVFKNNLLSDPVPIFQDAIEEWIANCSTNEKISKNKETLYNLNFAPKPEQSLALAYEAILLSTYEQDTKHRKSLRSRYRQKIERRIFQGLNWDEKYCKSRLEEWKRNLLKILPLLGTQKPGRWKQGYGISRSTAAAFMRHFVLKFIDNPDDKASGEVACMLWVLIWCGQEYSTESITIDWVCNLSSKHVHLKRPALYLFPGDEQNTIGISKGLHELLLCLLGESEGIRSHFLFKNVSQKQLERSLHKASALILGKDTYPVLPQAFLISPHSHTGKRISAQERYAERNARQIIPPRHTSKQMSALLKQANLKSSQSS